MSTAKNYWEFYGLQSDPFAIAEAEKNYYIPERWEQYLDALQFYCQNSNVLLVVTGDKKVGKTVFLKQFLNHVDEQMITTEIVATDTLDPKQCIDQLMQQLSLPSLQAESHEQLLDACLQHLLETQKKYLLVVDNAHVLPAKTLETLFYLIEQQSEAQVYLHILLVGLSPLKTRLSRLRGKENLEGMIYFTDLKTFTVDETSFYLQQRFNQAGLPAAMPLTPEKIVRLQQLSGGIPQRIDQCSKQALLAPIQKQWSVSTRGFIVQHKTKLLGSSVLLMALIIAASIITKNISQSMQMMLRTSSPVVALNAPMNTNAERPTVAQMANAAPLVAQTLQPNPNTLINLPTATNATTAQPIKQVATANIQPAKQAAVQVNQSTPKIVTVTKPQITAPANSPAAVFVQTPIAAPVVAHATTLTNTQVAIVKPQVVTAATKRVAISALAQAVASIQAPTPASPQLATIDKPRLLNSAHIAKLIALGKNQSQLVKEKAYVHKTKSNVALAALNSSQLISANPQHFTLQLIGLSSEAAMREFIATNDLGKQAVYYHSHLNNKDWYVLLYGQYASSEAAKAALDSLPATVKSQHPWVRTMANVQISLRKQMQANNA